MSFHSLVHTTNGCQKALISPKSMMINQFQNTLHYTSIQYDLHTVNCLKQNNHCLPDYHKYPLLINCPKQKLCTVVMDEMSRMFKRSHTLVWNEAPDEHKTPDVSNTSTFSTVSFIFMVGTLWNEAHFPPYPSYLWLKMKHIPPYFTIHIVSDWFFISETYTHCLTFEHTGHIGHAGYFTQCPLCCWSSLLIGYTMAGMEGWVFHELLPGTVTVTVTWVLIAPKHWMSQLTGHWSGTFILDVLVNIETFPEVSVWTLVLWKLPPVTSPSNQNVMVQRLEHRMFPHLQVLACLFTSSRCLWQYWSRIT